MLFEHLMLYEHLMRCESVWIGGMECWLMHHSSDSITPVYL
jgi:hypothetical protein